MRQSSCWRDSQPVGYVHLLHRKVLSCVCHASELESLPPWDFRTTDSYSTSVLPGTVLQLNPPCSLLYSVLLHSTHHALSWITMYHDAAGELVYLPLSPSLMAEVTPLNYAILKT